MWYLRRIFDPVIHDIFLMTDEAKILNLNGCNICEIKISVYKLKQLG